MRQKIEAAGARIVENSLLARIARLVLKSPNVAMVFGKQIHLSGVSTETFLEDTYWVEHELCHIEQYRSHGTLRFLGLYLLESFRKGYYENRFEVEARRLGRERALAAGKAPQREETGKKV
ncbi:hypothetical protein [Adhaeribacter soli]|uniref:DUF4157 domain-containing protein n=1 Tax=Adhaeribacter soli TaxID=2607655 RepID=A0A5N1IH85_9BACT|nr:hypothetical protein [Adhaeribacter soli]KAA9325023.1 hypothetical protein F0P94_19135 [Adhaeribacter soli]